MAPVHTIQRIQQSMRQLEQEAYQRGLEPVDYIRTKELIQPTNQQEYIQSMAELGIESDVSSDDTLSWSVELEEIEESLATFPERSQTLTQVNSAERNLLKQWVSKPPSVSQYPKKKENGQSFELESER